MSDNCHGINIDKWTKAIANSKKSDYDRPIS